MALPSELLLLQSTCQNHISGFDKVFSVELETQGEQVLLHIDRVYSFTVSCLFQPNSCPFKIQPVFAKTAYGLKLRTSVGNLVDSHEVLMFSKGELITTYCYSAKRYRFFTHD